MRPCTWKIPSCSIPVIYRLGWNRCDGDDCYEARFLTNGRNLSSMSPSQELTKTWAWESGTGDVAKDDQWINDQARQINDKVQFCVKYQRPAPVIMQIGQILWKFCKGTTVIIVTGTAAPGAWCLLIAWRKRPQKAIWISRCVDIRTSNPFIWGMRTEVFPRVSGASLLISPRCQIRWARSEL